MTSPEMRNRPAGQLGGLQNSSTAQIIQQAASLPPAAIIAELQVWASTVGLVLSGRCRRCGAPLWNAKSLHLKLGPVCAQRAPEGEARHAQD